MELVAGRSDKGLPSLRVAELERVAMVAVAAGAAAAAAAAAEAAVRGARSDFGEARLAILSS